MAAPRLVTLSDGVAEAIVAPDLGGGLASYDLVGAVPRAPLFRPCRDLSRAGPFDLANNLLVPWSNRISGGGFHFRGRLHRLEPNVHREPYPIHGNGFSSAWSVRNASAEKVELSLTSSGPGPFCYEARATYALHAGALSMWLSVGNLGPEPCPSASAFTLGSFGPRARLCKRKRNGSCWRTATICQTAKRLSLRASNGTSRRPAPFPRTGSITPS
jgi:aldose 1-epimerase